MVQVYGFTDNDPIVKTKKLWEDNLDLSANRAMMVTRELIRHGIAANRVETIAMGSTHPVASNSDKAGKAKNRRVEIVAIK
jgi:flagellar motor protein MotB